MNTTTIQGKLEFYDEQIPAKPVVILISGKAGSGKSSLANEVIKELTALSIQCHKTSFADAVKDIAMRYFEWDGKKDDSGRKLLQNIGMVGREYKEDLWALKVKDWIECNIYINFVVIDDWRFPNEFDVLSKNYQIVTVRLIRPNLEQEDMHNHISETCLDSFANFDYIGINYEIKDLTKIARNIVNSIL